MTISLDKSQFGPLMYALHNLVKAIASTQAKFEDTPRNARFLKGFGLSETEIGDILGMTQPAVNVALKRAKKKARKASKSSDDAVKKA